MNLDLRSADTAARRGMLGELAPTPFALAALEDRRLDVARVGYQKNGYGMNMADVRSAAPVPELFRDAIAAALRANGHEVVRDARFRIDGEVTVFWVELQPGLSMTAVGTSACTLRVVDQDADAVIHEASYTGHFTYPNTSAFQGAYEQALRAALERMVRELELDQRLVAALSEATSEIRTP